MRGICFYGHTHIPGVIRDDRACRYPKQTDDTFRFEPGRKYLFNPGSVGQPRDGNPQASYAIFDGAGVRYRRIKDLADILESGSIGK